MKYPLRNEYETAVRNIDIFVFDNVLKRGKPVTQTKNSQILRSYNGGKAIVYEIQTNSRKYALKCWVEDLGDLKIRYKAIDKYLKQINLPYFVDFCYTEQGILVDGQKFPIIRMEWIDGINFKKFISNNIHNPTYIRNFAEKFLEMVKELHQNNISHGDLQHGNIMLRKNGDICLIDYDSLYVPQLRNEKDNIKGLDDYQHPNRSKLNKLSPKSDYFSELVIYLSLLAISEKTSYWTQIKDEERLLFSKQDLANPHLSPRFTELKKLSPEIQYFTRELENFCVESDLEALQPLEKLSTAYTGVKRTWDWDVVSNPTPNFPPPEPVPIDSDNDAWNPVSTNGTQSSPRKVSTQNPWSKLDTNKSAWDTFDNTQQPVKNESVWNPLDEKKKQEPVKNESESLWNIFDDIWNTFFQSVSSVWNKFMSWLK